MALLSVDSTVVARVPGLVPLRRGARVLVLAPATGAAVLLSGGRLRAFGRLERPVTVGALRADLPADELEAFLGELDQGGFLSVAGRPPRPPQESRERPAFAAVLKSPLPEDLPPGRLLVELAEDDLEAMDRLPAGTVVWIRTRGDLVDAKHAERLAGAHLALCLHEVPAADDPWLQRLPEALAAGLSVAPVAVVSRPGQALELFGFLTGLGFRTLRFEGASAADLVALAAAARAFPAPVRIHPLDALAKRLLTGSPAGHPPDDPRCERCGFQRTCEAGSLGEECREWRTLAEGLLWALKG